MNPQEFRANVLASYGASTSQIEELLAYNHNLFDHSYLTHPLKFPLAPEPHLVAWEEYAAAARVLGAFEALRRVIVQFRFPIKLGISQTEVYRSATRKGLLVDGAVEATGLVLQQPEELQLRIHQSFAGAIPVSVTGNREDFVTLVQALTMRNEPLPVPASMGACMVAGYNNWSRIDQYRLQWQAKNPANCSKISWAAQFQQLMPQKQLYQDQFIILSDGPYSNVPASEMGLSEAEWRRLSLTIRLEHECTHYFTRRLFQSMRNNLLDELIADYRGIVSAIGHYRADWFLRFLGLESFPAMREGGRLQNYRGQPPLSKAAFKILQMLVKAAAENLEYFNVEQVEKLTDTNIQPLMLIGLSYLTLEELASPEAKFRIQQTLDKLTAAGEVVII